MAKSVYIETTVFSFRYTTRRDVASRYRREATEQWWQEQSAAYDLYTSAASMQELASGRFAWQAQAMAMASAMKGLEITDEVIGTARVYARHLVMPQSASGDALHLAVASHYEVDYLLTWNVRHIANPSKLEHITVINRRLGFLTPTIVTPEALWEDRQP